MCFGAYLHLAGYSFLQKLLTDHFDLFGLRQIWLYFVKKTYMYVSFAENLIYRWIRHPMMLGTMIAFWALPTMTVGHLVLSRSHGKDYFKGLLS
ncbi:MAG: hypothetical protein A6F72_00650 [Cycloclasticus sp. symbiont of Poecilosclerida sp. N]|nr:MAG: hypothetical protein A6F72_00650 [Cycloclasticus sp. symbiont of Poecilosclerida sp. N]